MRTVRRRIAAGDLPRPFKIGGIAYWRQRVLDAWLGKRERAGADSQGRVL
jgi:predicted DNA-binding transcriptional regulator AlpA